MRTFSQSKTTPCLCYARGLCAGRRSSLLPSSRGGACEPGFIALAALACLLLVPCAWAGPGAELELGLRLYAEDTAQAAPHFAAAAGAQDASVRARANLYLALCRWSLHDEAGARKALVKAYLADPGLEVEKTLVNPVLGEVIARAREEAAKALARRQVLAKSYRLRIESIPSGAKVMIKGKKLGRLTPFTLRFKKGGTFPVTLRKGDLSWSGHVKLDTPGTTKTLRRTLRSGKATLVVKVSHPGAWVAVNGVRKGLAPLRLSLAPGSYQVTAGAAGRAKGAGSVILAPGKTQSLSIALPRLCPVGMIYVPRGTYRAGTYTPKGTKGYGDEVWRLARTSPYCIDRYEYPNVKNRLPQEGKTWFEAVQLCAAKGKRLCTGDEWERAARGTDGRKYPYGNRWNPKRCNTVDAFGRKRDVAPCGSFAGCVSPVGAYDMCGNLWEWVSDPYTRFAPRADPALRVIRGGSHYKGKEECRAANIAYFKARRPNGMIGFRCCADAK